MSTMVVGHDADRRPVEGPMERPAGYKPPCGVCPKIEKGEPAQPLAPDADLFAQEWFWQARQWFRECRAVGDFGTPDPLMRAVAAELDAAERKLAGRAADLTAALLARIAGNRR